MNKENVAYTLRVCVLNMAYKKKKRENSLKKERDYDMDEP